MTPAEELRAAARLLRERAQAVIGADWGTRPWEVTECVSPDRGDCPCIVMQGEYAPLTEAQRPPIYYIADAESPELATFIAGMHPGLALALAALLDDEADRATGMDGREDSDAYPLMLHGLRLPLAVARACLGTLEATP